MNSEKIRKSLELHMVATRQSFEHEGLSGMVTTVSGEALVYAQTLPENSAERSEVMLLVTMLHDAHSDLTQAIHRVRRSCLYLDGVLNPEDDDDDTDTRPAGAQEGAET